MSTPGASSSQLCPIENFGVVPMLTSVTLSFSPGLAVISVTLNFIVSLPVISMARPSCTCLAGAAAVEEAPEVAGAAEPGSPAGGAEQPATKVAKRSAGSAKYRVMESFLRCSLVRRGWTASLSQSNNGGPGTGIGSRESGESGIGAMRVAGRTEGWLESKFGRLRGRKDGPR